MANKMLSTESDMLSKLIKAKLQEGNNAQGKMLIQNLAQEEGEKALRKMISNNMTQQAQTNPQGLASTLAGVHSISNQSGQNNNQSNNQQAKSSTGSDPFDMPENLPAELKQSLEAEKANPTETGIADTDTTTKEKKGYGWPMALMMMGQGLQGGNPMDVLSGILQLQAQRETLSQKRESDMLSLVSTELENVRKDEKAGRLKPNEIFTKFTQLSQPFTEVRDGFSRISAAMTNVNTGNLDFSGNNPAGDLDLLFGTAKTLDPSGRVTDSDIAIQTMATGKYGDKFQKIAQKFNRKGFLAPEERKALYKAAQTRFKAAERQQVKTNQTFRDLAVKNNINPENVTLDLGLAQTSTNNDSNVAYGTTSSGNKFREVQ